MNENNIMMEYTEIKSPKKSGMIHNSTHGKTSTEPEYRGLKNQAMTCYLNSILQALFMTPELRNALYNWKFDDNANIDKSKSFAFQLQKLFLNLQTSPRHIVETTELTHCLGWDSDEKWQAHDTQECCNTIFKILEEEFKNTINNDLLNRLFQGFYIDYWKCQECGFEKQKETPFMNIALPIRSFGSTNAYESLTEALQGFIEPELLDGNNKVFCEFCEKKCYVQKSLKFTEFPYILNLQFKRVDFDPVNCFQIKLNDKITFPLKLNLNGFILNHKNNLYQELFKSSNKCDESGKNYFSELVEINQNENIDGNYNQHTIENKHEVYLNSENEPVGPYMYELYAIMIHFGSVTRGHYSAYIKDLKTEKWFCFNDQFVSEITIDDIEQSFGGGPSHAKRNTGSGTAYMLMYRQIDKSRNQIAMSQDEFPLHLKNLYNVIEGVYGNDNGIKEKENFFKVTVIYFGKYDVWNKEFDCNESTTVDQLKTMAIQTFNVITPCELVIFNKLNQTVCENMIDISNSLVCNLNYNSSFGFLLQTVDTVDGGSKLAPSKYVPMKFCMMNLNNIQGMLTNDSMTLKVKGNKEGGTMSDYLIRKCNISNKFVLYSKDRSDSRNLVILDKTFTYHSVYPNVVYVLTECQDINLTDFMLNLKNVMIEYENAIHIQFIILSSKFRVGCDLLTEDSHCVVNPQDLCDTVIVESGDQNENDILGSERTSTVDSEDLEIPPSVFDDVDMEDVEYDELDEHNDNIIVDDNNDNNLQFDKNYHFQVISHKAVKHSDGKLCAYVDERMTIKQLKNHLVPFIGMLPDYFSLFKLNSDGEFVELDLPDCTLQNLNLFDTIQIPSGISLNGICGLVFWPVSSDRGKIVWEKLFDWIITVGTSVLDTKKELMTKLNETQNTNIPLERLCLYEKKEDRLTKFYYDEEFWNEDIGQGWEIAIIIITDSSELDKLNACFVGHSSVFAIHVEDSKQLLISM